MLNRGERRDAVEHRQLILRTAQALFDQHGVDNVSMHQIAKSAGIGQGTLYRRYNHKSDLCFALMKESFHIFREDISDYLQRSQGEKVRTRLEAVIRKVFDFLGKKSAWLSVIQRQPETCREGRASPFHSPPYQFIYGTIRDLLKEGMERKECHAINPDFSAHALLCSVSPDLMYFLEHEEKYTLAQILESYIQLFLDPLFPGEGP